MRGNLSEINVSDLVTQIYYSKRSGILRLTQDEVRKSIYFKEGAVVFAHSNLKNERLGEILLRLGKITEEEFQIVTQEMEEGRRLGQALWEKGFLSPADVTAGVSYQLQQIIYSVFNWVTGEYEFVERERPVFEDIMVDVSTPTVLIDGIRNITNQVVLERAVGRDEKQLVSLNTDTNKLPRADLDFAEETILSCVDGKVTIEKLRTVTRLSPQEFSRALYSLWISGIVRFQKASGEPPERIIRAEVQQRWSSFTTQPMAPKESESEQEAAGPLNRLKTISEPELRTLVADTEKKFKRTVTDEEVLNVLPDCTLEEIRKAYDNITAIFHPAYYSTTRYHDLKDALKLIIDRVSDAYTNLLDKATERRPFLETPLATPQPAPVQAATIDLLPEHEATTGKGSPALEVSKRPPEVSVPPPQSAVIDFPKTIPEPSPVRSEAPRAVYPMTQEEIEFGEPEREFGLAELQTRIKKEPNNVVLLRQLGRKLQHTGKAREGEKYLLHALEVEPQNIETHFALADFYQVQGLKFKAFKHLNIILQLDPENQHAMEILGVKRRKKPLYEIGGEE